MDRMKIIKRRLSMSLRSARPVDDSLSELAEQMALDEPSAARDNGENDGRQPQQRKEKHTKHRHVQASVASRGLNTVMQCLRDRKLQLAR